MADTSSTEYILRTRDIVKRYKAVVALDRVSVNIRRGTIHGLLGENGAGKSTLVGLISGLISPTEGTVEFAGEEVQGFDVKQMEARGVFLVTQEPMIVESMSVADNLMLGHWPVKRGFTKTVDQRALMANAVKALEGTGLDPRMSARELSAVAKRKLNILRALYSGGKLLILDEPTAALTLADRDHLFSFMQSLKAQGVSFVFISHYNEEILSICDGVTVLRNGRLAGEMDNLDGIDSDAMSELVIGRDVPLFHRTRGERETSSDASWQVSGLEARNINIDSFSIKPGEIVGFAGLPGSGAKEFGLALFGLNRASRGRIKHDGREMDFPDHPQTAFANGIAYLSDDRHRDGLVGLQSIAQNITMSSLAKVSKAGVIDAPAERSVVKRYFEHLRVKAATPKVLLGTLSGGNQQKVCLGRVLATDPKLLILDEPTRGIDVGAKHEIYNVIYQLAERGCAIVMISSELPEVLGVSDRIVVMRQGRIAGELPRGQANEQSVLNLALPVQSEPTAQAA
jgi:simple sugar transport system ATP-binding protein